MKKGYYFGKKKICIICIIFISLCVSFIFPNLRFETVRGGAQTDKATEAELEENIRDQLGKLELEELEKYVESISSFSDKGVMERIIDYVKGEKFDYDGFGKQILSVFFSKVTEILPAFVCITAIAVLSGLISSIKSQALFNTSTDLISLITYTATLIPLIAVLMECFSQTKGSILEMEKQVKIVFPLLLTLMAASGGTATAAICQPAVAFFGSTIVSIIVSIVLPITVTIIAFSMASHLTNELKIGKFTAFFKSINKWIIGISITVFGLFFTLQGLTAAHSDGIVRRAVKYALGNGIPIVGGFLSGGFDLAVAGSVLIKNALGSMSIFLMISVVFEPLILLIAVNVLLRLTAAIAQPLGDGKVADFLGETAENLNYCTASLLFTAFLYFLTIVLMITASEALF